MEFRLLSGDIINEWESYHKTLSSAIKSDSSLLNQINSYILENRGKQIRPILGIVSAKACGETNHLTICSAVVSEMIHTATLLHDDVADSAQLRRGAPTVHTLYNPAASILTGDFWLAKALSLIVEQKDSTILGLFTGTVEDLSEGELFQMQKAGSFDTTREDYYSIIYRKTASLFVATVKSCVYSTGAGHKTLDIMEEYARNLGIAFQIRDDIFDYMPDLNTGKSAGNDIRESKITLPLIAAMEIAGVKEREKIISLLKEKGDTPENVKEIIFAFVKKYSGIALAQATLTEHTKKAEEAISSLKESSYKRDLIEFTKFVGNRFI
ncbi:MAG: polyprenyl synthetase family protein [Bacteroidales bacterium]|nr:polyprenyl synthetase family protein [Bacteroidales bacterium]MDD2424454.1 polyprenyl synthetase family protein [Bacteroidales bacterium]MDD3989827.1 polyprenyl synthetase family protein [Bacteroidales bacterium]